MSNYGRKWSGYSTESDKTKTRQNSEECPECGDPKPDAGILCPACEDASMSAKIDRYPAGGRHGPPAPSHGNSTR